MTSGQFLLLLLVTLILYITISEISYRKKFFIDDTERKWLYIFGIYILYGLYILVGWIYLIITNWNNPVLF